MWVDSKTSWCRRRKLLCTGDLEEVRAARGTNGGSFPPNNAAGAYAPLSECFWGGDHLYDIMVIGASYFVPAAVHHAMLVDLANCDTCQRQINSILAMRKIVHWEHSDEHWIGKLTARSLLHRFKNTWVGKLTARSLLHRFKNTWV